MGPDVLFRKNPSDSVIALHTVTMQTYIMIRTTLSEYSVALQGEHRYEKALHSNHKAEQLPSIKLRTPLTDKTLYFDSAEFVQRSSVSVSPHTRVDRTT